jgi:hypothetical protein
MKLHVWFWVVTAALLSCGCQHRVSGIVGRTKGIDGLTEQELLSKMGEPFRWKEYTASAHDGKFHTGLQRIYARLQNEDVRIHELTWDRTNYALTAWLYETNGSWVAFDNLKYGKNVKF